MQYLSWAADIIAIATTIFALGGWIQSSKVRKILEAEKERQNQRITLTLVTEDGSKSYKLGIEPRRFELTRAEVLGFLGMLPMKKPGGRFHLEYPSKSDFFNQLDEVRSDPFRTELNIYVTQEEYEQFDL